MLIADHDCWPSIIVGVIIAMIVCVITFVVVFLRCRYVSTFVVVAFCCCCCKNIIKIQVNENVFEVLIMCFVFHVSVHFKSKEMLVDVLLFMCYALNANPVTVDLFYCKLIFILFMSVFWMLYIRFSTCTLEHLWSILTCAGGRIELRRIMS